jgi:CRISPR-associated protein Cas1
MWKTVIVDKGERITLDSGWLVVSVAEREAKLPIEDVYSVVVDNKAAVLSVSVINALTASGAHIIVCDDKHFPASVILPNNTHYRPVTVLNNQLSISTELKSALWQRIVKSKIENQYRVLKLCGVKAEKQQSVFELIEKVQPGDPRNYEAVAARRYFPALFGAAFRRSDEDVANYALNYGYAILRSAMAKALCGYGFNCALGIHHMGETNAFNLADDLMEPFRPIVDLWTDESMDMLYNELTAQNRRELIDLVNRVVVIDGKRMRIRYAIDRCAASLATAITRNDPNALLLPQIVPLSFEAEDEGV